MANRDGGRNVQSIRWVVRAEAQTSVNIFYDSILENIVVARSVQSLLPVEVSHFLHHSVDCFIKHYWEGPASALLSEERVRKSVRLKKLDHDPKIEKTETEESQFPLLHQARVGECLVLTLLILDPEN